MMKIGDRVVEVGGKGRIMEIREIRDGRVFVSEVGCGDRNAVEEYPATMFLGDLPVGRGGVAQDLIEFRKLRRQVRGRATRRSQLTSRVTDCNGTVIEAGDLIASVLLDQPGVYEVAEIDQMGCDRHMPTFVRIPRKGHSAGESSRLIAGLKLRQLLPNSLRTFEEGGLLFRSVECQYVPDQVVVIAGEEVQIHDRVANAQTGQSGAADINEIEKRCDETVDLAGTKLVRGDLVFGILDGVIRKWEGYPPTPTGIRVPSPGQMLRGGYYAWRGSRTRNIAACVADCLEMSGMKIEHRVPEGEEWIVEFWRSSECDFSFEEYEKRDMPKVHLGK